MDTLTEEIDQELRSAAEKFGIDYDAMCISDNTSCEPQVNKLCEIKRNLDMYLFHCNC